MLFLQFDNENIKKIFDILNSDLDFYSFTLLMFTK